MHNPNTDLLFPRRVIQALRDERGEVWMDLVNRVADSEEESTDQMAFILMMVRLDNCSACNADSFRSMHGCSTCAKQALKRFRGTDEELIEMFKASKTEVVQYLLKKSKTMND